MVILIDFLPFRVLNLNLFICSNGLFPSTKFIVCVSNLSNCYIIGRFYRVWTLTGLKVRYVFFRVFKYKVYAVFSMTKNKYTRWYGSQNYHDHVVILLSASIYVNPGIALWFRSRLFALEACILIKDIKKYNRYHSYYLILFLN